MGKFLCLWGVIISSSTLYAMVKSVGVSDQLGLLVVVISRRLSRRGKLCRRIQPYEAEITNFQQNPPTITASGSVFVS